MIILYKLASRSRPIQFFATLDNIISNAVHEDYIILCSLDIDDDSMTHPEIKGRIQAYGDKVHAYWGFSGSKIAAINRDIPFVYEWDILVNVSDDQRFMYKGFDMDIIEAFEGFSGLAHFVDIHRPGICTMSIIDRDYYHVDGFIYHPSFMSVYCDNFQQEIAKKRNRYKFINTPIFTHYHFRNGNGVKDEQMERTESDEMYTRDRKVRDELRKQYKLS